MKFKIIRSKFLEGLASVSKIVEEHCKNQTLSIILAEMERGKPIEPGAAFRNGLIVRPKNNYTCPLCGSDLEIRDDYSGNEFYVCDKCNHSVPEELFQPNAYVASIEGIAEFVRKSIGGTCCRSCGDGNYRLGKVFGMNAFFCGSPNNGFFNSHSENTLLIICDTSSVPHGWVSSSCKVVPFAELFYTKDHGKEICLDEDCFNALKPKDASKRRFGKNRHIHDRRDAWLVVLMHILTAALNKKDIHAGKFTATAAERWFKKVHPRIGIGYKTISRDMEEFRLYDKENDAYDKREPLIVELLKYAATTEQMELRLKAANGIKALLAKAAEDTKRNGGEMAELPDTGWVIGADGSSECVPVTSEDSVIDSVDSNLRKDQRGERAA